MDDNTLHIGYECSSCLKVEFIAVDPKDMIYADDGMIATGWVTDHQGTWMCSDCVEGGG